MVSRGVEDRYHQGIRVFACLLAVISWPRQSCGDKFCSSFSVKAAAGCEEGLRKKDGATFGSVFLQVGPPGTIQRVD